MMRKETTEAQTEPLEPVPGNITNDIVFSQQMPFMEYPMCELPSNEKCLQIIAVLEPARARCC